MPNFSFSVQFYWITPFCSKYFLRHRSSHKVYKYMFVGHINPARNREIDKCFGGEFDYKDIKFPVKIRDIHKIEKT